VVEYCKIINSNEVVLEGESILSQLYLPESVTRVPGKTLLHTLVLNTLSESGHNFVTIGFGVDDDLKESSSDHTVLKVKGVSLVNVLPHLGLTVEDIWNPNTECSLWNARIFPGINDCFTEILIIE
jgi:hypothetical protein